MAESESGAGTVSFIGRKSGKEGADILGLCLPDFFESGTSGVCA
jgi:hypothetical protein